MSRNALAITSNPSLALDMADIYLRAAIVVAVATGGLLIWRVFTGTRPQRRALAIGTPIALLFLVCQIVFLALTLAAPEAGLRDVMQWAFAGARAAIWYGFLFALIAAQLFAARALERLVGQSLRRPPKRELEAMLREPLGDPHLRLVFRDPKTGTWPDGDLTGGPPEQRSRRDVTVVERDGKPAVAVLHDAQLDDDPELLQGAGAVALLAEENAELDTAWNDALQELRRSRARIVLAGDNERRKFERNLHDGVQQRLVAIGIDLGLARDLAAEGSVIRSRLEGIGQSVEDKLDELREVSHGLYPPVLTDWGVVTALERIQLRASSRLAIHATGIGRYPAELESAIYYCCLEAIQNATKHSGDAAHVAVTLHEDAAELRFEVSDDGPGFDSSKAHGGTGLQNMHDRLGALDGRLSIVTAAGQGTVVAGSIPLREVDMTRRPRASDEARTGFSTPSRPPAAR